jgi:2'-5' RNA ligase
VEGLGAFPSVSRARVVWAGTHDGPPALARLAGAVDTVLAPLGFAAETRPFTGHVTLGRVRQPHRDPALEAAVAAGLGRRYGTVRVERLSLMRSDLGPGGARYSEVRRLPLAGDGVGVP